MDLYQSKFCLGHKTQKMSGGGARRPTTFGLAKQIFVYCKREQKIVGGPPPPATHLLGKQNLDCYMPFGECVGL
jgi:hypothetical protein